MSEERTARRLNLANPRDDSQANRPRLLRRVADAIEAHNLDPIDELDLTLSQEMTAMASAGQQLFTGRLSDEGQR